jgi:hypothetical protein
MTACTFTDRALSPQVEEQQLHPEDWLQSSAYAQPLAIDNDEPTNECGPGAEQQSATKKSLLLRLKR